MDRNLLRREAADRWVIDPSGAMVVPAIIYADGALIDAMDDKVRQQMVNVASLPGIVTAAYAMPDAHWGYGFPIGGVAAVDPERGGVVSAGGVGFDISCGVRALLTHVPAEDIRAVQTELADTLFGAIPAGLGSTGALTLDLDEMDAMLAAGARWAVEQGYGREDDLERIEERGCMAGARPECVSEKAKHRQRKQVGTLGSGNHYLEMQEVTEIHDTEAARAFGLEEGTAVISIHCGSRGLGHQIGTEFLREMVLAANEYGIALPDRELACAPIRSTLGQRYLGAMRAGINCALANRQVIAHLARRAFAEVVPEASLDLLFDVSHNTCKVERHAVDGAERDLFVHRKGATRAFGPGHPDLPDALRPAGQPVLIGGSMGTASYILAGTAESEALSFGSACHGAGRATSRRQALKRHSGRQVQDRLAARGILIRSPSMRGIAEEAPDAYKDVSAVVDVADAAGLARKVARLEPMITIKG